MDSLQGIPVEYKLDTFNMPRTGTTLCHPQNWLCRFDAQLSSRHLALNLPLGHFNGDNAHSSPDAQNYTVTLKFNSSNCNMAFAKLRRTQSLARPTSHTAISAFSISHNSISSPYSQSYSPRVLQHQKQTQYSMLQIKLIPKTHFDNRHLTSSSLPLFTFKT